MNLLVLLLLIPMAFADSPPGCDELSRIVQNYEEKLQRSFPGNSNPTSCSNFKVEDFTPASTEAGAFTFTQQDSELFEANKCSPLSSIEAQIEQLRNEVAVFEGIEKMKSNLQTSQAQTGNTNLPRAQAAGNSFVRSLDTAQSLELLLQSQNSKNDSFVSELKKLPLAQRKNLVDFSTRIAELCRGTESSDKANACDNKIFKPSQSTVDELNALIDQNEPNAEKIKQWQDALAIRKKGAAPEEAAYSFTQMRQEMESAFDKLDKDERLSRSELKVIRNLDQFENLPGHSFVENIATMKDKFKNQFIVDEFRFLVEDAQLRQKHEVQSKISIVWNEVNSLLPSLDERSRNACASAKTNYDEAMICQSVLEGNADTIPDSNVNAKAHIKSLIAPLKASMDYVGKLSTLAGQCLTDATKNGALSNECANQISGDKAALQKKILVLNLLKEKIGTENQKDMAYRNFALMKWNSQRCSSKVAIDSSIEFCQTEDIAKEAVLLTSNVLNISLVYSPKPEAESVAETLCDSDDPQTGDASKLCKFFNDTTSNIVETNNVKKDPNADGPIAAPKREGSSPQKEAWLTGINNALTTIANQYRAPMWMPNRTNPYAYNFSPYNVTSPMGISDTILFNARYTGAYGFYMPTAGYKPYSSTLGSSAAPMVSPYTSARPSISTTAFFGTFGN